MGFFLTVFLISIAVNVFRTVLTDFRAEKSSPVYYDYAEDEKPDIAQSETRQQDLEFWELRYYNLVELRDMTRAQLKAETDEKKQTAILRKLITLDNQIYTARKKVKSLEMELEW